MSPPVLVAGAGYLGSAVALELLERGVAVRAVVAPRHPSDAPQPPAVAMLRSAGAEVVARDLTTAEGRGGLCEGGVRTVVCCLAASLLRPVAGTIERVDRDATIALFEELAAAASSGGGSEQQQQQRREPPPHFVLVATFEGRDARRCSRLHEAKEAAADHVAARAAEVGMRATIVRQERGCLLIWAERTSAMLVEVQSAPVV